MEKYSEILYFFCVNLKFDKLRLRISFRLFSLLVVASSCVQGLTIAELQALAQKQKEEKAKERALAAEKAAAEKAAAERAEAERAEAEKAAAEKAEAKRAEAERLEAEKAKAEKAAAEKAEADETINQPSTEEDKPGEEPKTKPEIKPEVNPEVKPEKPDKDPYFGNKDNKEIRDTFKDESEQPGRPGGSSGPTKKPSDDGKVGGKQEPKPSANSPNPDKKPYFGGNENGHGGGSERGDEPKKPFNTTQYPPKPDFKGSDEETDKSRVYHLRFLFTKTTSKLSSFFFK